VVVASGQIEHRSGQIVGKGSPVGGRPEADLRVDGERRHGRAVRVGPAQQGTDLAHYSAGQRDEVACRQMVVGGVGIGRGRADGCGGYDVGCGRCPQDPLGDASVPALLDQLHQAVRLERLEVVADLLARETDAHGELCGGARNSQLAQQPGADRIQYGSGRPGVFDDFDVLHATTMALDKNNCQGLDDSVVP